MALLNVTLSGGWRLSSVGQSGGVDLVTKSFSALTPLTSALGGLSTFIAQEVTLGTTVSEFLLSYAQLSAPQVIFLQSTNVVRVNFGGNGSAFSQASASQITFREAFLLMSVSGALPSGIHLGNSGTDSAVVTVLIAG